MKFTQLSLFDLNMIFPKKTQRIRVKKKGGVKWEKGCGIPTIQLPLFEIQFSLFDEFDFIPNITQMENSDAYS